MAFDWSQYSIPTGAGSASLTAWWNDVKTKYDAYRAANESAWMQKESDLSSQYSPWSAPIWEGSPQQVQYAGYQGSMQALLDRIGQGPATTDTAQAMADAAAAYGYSPASWTELQAGMASMTNASNVMTNAGDIAVGMEGTQFGQEQAAATRQAEQQATEDVGKQLENIFGERGGLAGFQAAYDLTSQIQSTFVQQAAKNSLDMLDRAITEINSQNTYYQGLIQNGALLAKDYLNLRWNALQTSYQDYVTAMDQTMKQWQTLEQVSKDQYQAAQDNISRQLDAVDKQMAAEMGFDDARYKEMYQSYVDAMAIAKAAEAQAGAGNKALGNAMLTIGAAMLTSGLASLNPILIILGIFGTLFGSLFGGNSGTGTGGTTMGGGGGGRPGG